MSETYAKSEEENPGKISGIRNVDTTEGGKPQTEARGIGNPKQRSGKAFGR